MRLSETVTLMNSKDYKERFQAEYHQLEIRLNKLLETLDKCEHKMPGNNPACPTALLKKQSDIMRDYLTILQYRAQLEGIKL